jgi:hypothetical protein
LSLRSDILLNITGNTYYIDAVYGNDITGNGTSLYPWKTITKSKTVPVGSIIILRSGNYGEFDDVNYSNRSSWSVYIADVGHTPEFTNIAYYGNGDVRTKFFGIKIAPAWVNPGQSAPYIKTASPLNLYGCNHIRFYECEIVGTNKYLTPQLSYISGSTNILFERCHAHKTGGGFVYLNSSNITFNYNYVHEICGSIFNDGWAGGSYVTIEGNHAHNAGYNTSDQYGEDASFHGSIIGICNPHTVVRNNFLHDGGGTSGINFYEDGSPILSNILIENNVLYNTTNSVAMVLESVGTNVTIRNNTICGKKRDELGEDLMYNYSFYFGSLYPGFDGSGINIYNNIFVGAVTIIPPTTNMLIDNNIAYYSAGEDVDTVHSIIAYEDKTSDYFESGFFNGNLNLKYGTILDSALNLTIKKESDSINFGDPLNQPSDCIGELDINNQFIIPSAVVRNSLNHDAGAYQTKIKNIDRINSTTYKAENLGQVKPFIKVGGNIAGKFIPNVNVSFGFGGTEEYFININNEDKIVIDEESILEFGEVHQKIDLETDKYYIDNDGRLKWDTLYDSIPSKLKIEYKMEYTDGIVFEHQPPLTLEEIARGTIRPENIVNSYAIYCNKKNNKYTTGKLGHIYRPFVIDADNNKEWCNIEIKNKKITIDLPEDFMNNAIYPVRLDPTFGYDTLGASVDNYWSNLFLSINAGSPASDGTLTKLAIACYNAGSGFNVKLGIYSDDAGMPDALVDSTGAIEITHTVKPDADTSTWDNGAVTESITSATTYHLAMDHESNNNYIAYDTVALIGRSYAVAYASFPPDPAATTTNSNYHWSIFAEYTAAGGSGTPLAVYYYNQLQQGII